MCSGRERAICAGTTTTSGLSYKISGRVGDSPIIGAGLYVDSAVGATGSTGRGEANLQNCTSFLIVELMRAGHSPEDACFTAMQRVADHTEPRLRRKDGKPGFDLKLYAPCEGWPLWRGDDVVGREIARSTMARRLSSWIVLRLYKKHKRSATSLFLHRPIFEVAAKSSGCALSKCAPAVCSSIFRFFMAAATRSHSLSRLLVRIGEVEFTD